MILKEARADRWAVLVGLSVLVLRLVSVVPVDLKAQTLGTLTTISDANFSAVTAGHIAVGTAYLWATFFGDVALYLLVGVGGACLGAGLIANEIDSGSIYVLLSRPLSRTQILLTKYGVAAAFSLALCTLSGCLAVLVGAWQGVSAPPLGGWVISMVLLWLGMLFVMGLTLLYSLLVAQTLVAGILGFFTTYILILVPTFHTNTADMLHPHYLLGPDWSLVTYWSSLGIYSGAMSALKALVVAVLAAALPAVVALVLFQRRRF